MDGVDVAFDLDQNCSLYELSEYVRNSEHIPELRALSKEERRQKRGRDKEGFERFWLSFAYDCDDTTPPSAVPALAPVCDFVEEYHLASGQRILRCDDLERVLKEAVEDEIIVPVMGPIEASGYFHTQSAIRSAGDGLLSEAGSSSTLLSNVLSSGEPLLFGPYDPALQEAKLKAARGEFGGAVGSTGGGSGSSFDWLGTAEAVVGSVLGAVPNGDDDSMLKSFGDTDDSDGGSLLGNAQLFEYQPDGLFDQTQDVAGVFLTPAEEAGCDLQYELDMAECSTYAAMDKGYWGTCKERAMQRYSNCLRGRFTG